MGAPSKLTILRYFITSNFSYCCHIWCFCSVTLKDRLEKLQFRGLRYVYDDYNSSYEALLKKAGMDSIALLLQKTMLVEIYKCLKWHWGCILGRSFRVREGLHKVKRYKSTVVDSTLCGLHSIPYHGTELWAAMPDICKTANGIKCKCRACKFTNSIICLVVQCFYVLCIYVSICF